MGNGLDFVPDEPTPTGDSGYGGGLLLLPLRPDSALEIGSPISRTALRHISRLSDICMLHITIYALSLYAICYLLQMWS